MRFGEATPSLACLAGGSGGEAEAGAESAAEQAGIQPGDRILELNGAPVQRAGQVIRAVRLQPDAKPLELLLERGGRQLRLQITLPLACDPCMA